MIQAAKLSGASRIIAIDMNSGKFSAARKMGATDCIDASRVSSMILVKSMNWDGLWRCCSSGLDCE